MPNLLIGEAIKNEQFNVRLLLVVQSERQPILRKLRSIIR
jgi:hypothetical protein